ncbi:glycosyltransferase [Stenomitos frigidus]|uniref:Glycosyltransferase n=1 Tax=Stenomitos frigidus ULC18 TaxID=2107698 RepID=A0A2T1ED29_9CYAN|nr:glycosyltransferase [Stenomitos frigidus]PSB30593.1 hypothetical protein C7B82_08600 [Stenomitos frigidus ULC18]
MNILIVSSYLNYPCNNGASVAQFATLEYLSKLCNVSLLLPENHSITRENLHELSKLLPYVKIYELGDSNFLSSKGRLANKGGKRFLSAARLLKNGLSQLMNYLPVFSVKTGRALSNRERFTRDYASSSSNPYLLLSQSFVDKLLEIISIERINLVQIEFVENLSLVTIIPDHVKKVYLSHESRLARIQSHIEEKQLQSIYADYVYNFNHRIKKAFLSEFDAISTFSDHDTFTLEVALGEASKRIQFSTMPFPVFDEDFKEISVDTFQMPNKLIFVGGDSHYPNKEAAEWFINEVSVEVREQFGLMLHIIGKWDEKTVERYKKHPGGVNFVGYVDNLYEASKNSISISPITIGAGLKTKIITAMAQGLPVIATEFSLAGINVKHMESVLVANDKKAFLWSIDYLLKDIKRTFLICKNAQDSIKSTCSQAIVSKLKYNFYKDVLAGVAKSGESF